MKLSSPLEGCFTDSQICSHLIGTVLFGVLVSVVMNVVLIFSYLCASEVIYSTVLSVD